MAQPPVISRYKDLTDFPGMVRGETPSGLVNGSNATYTTANAFVPGTVEVLINGMAQRITTDFVTTGTTTIALTSSPLTGDSVRVNYTKA